MEISLFFKTEQENSRENQSTGSIKETKRGLFNSPGIFIWREVGVGGKILGSVITGLFLKLVCWRVSLVKGRPCGGISSS